MNIQILDSFIYLFIYLVSTSNIDNSVCSLSYRLELSWLDLIDMSTTSKFSKFC